MTVSEDIVSALRPGTLETLAEEAEAQGKLPAVLLQEILDRHMPSVRLKEGAESRRYPRMPAGLDASVFLDELDNLMEGHKVSIQNISMSGLSFSFSREASPALTVVSVNSEITLKFSLPGEQEPVLFHGKVCHVHQMGDEYHVGVRFGTDDFEGYIKLSNYFETMK